MNPSMRIETRRAVLREIMKTDDERVRLRDLVTLQLTALNEWLGGYGVEAISDPDDLRTPAMEYVNFGDTYDTTVIYDHQKGRFEISSWGDWLERAEKRGFKGGQA